MLETSVLSGLQTVVGIGVAGNFAGHLEQAGEAADFAGIGAPGHEAPKGIFPWFVPGAATAPGVPDFLGTFPLSSTEIARPAGDVNLQIEPEVGVVASVMYGNDGTVTGISPIAIGAFNDCSIRRPGAAKISHKKNWGASSKGFAATLLPIDDLSPAGPTATYRLASFLRRDGATSAYGVDSPLPAYSYYGDQLLNWIVERINNQEGPEGTPLEPIGAYFKAAGRPATVVIAIGATRYTAVGASTYLEVGDESIVVVYDSALTTRDAVEVAVTAGLEDDILSASVLRQRVIAA
jgi:hypothetical protein